MKKQEELKEEEKQETHEVDSDEVLDEEPAGESAEEAPDVEENVEEVEQPTPREEEKIAAMERQYEELHDRFTRLAAEFDNYKKRTTREYSNLIKSANEQLISGLLEVLDNFDRAFESKEKGTDLESYDRGMKLVYNRLMDTLSRAGLKKFASVGQKFDPNLHEALTQVEDEEKEPDTVAQEFQPGYYLNDKVLRHAKVGVVKSKDES